MKSVMKFEAYTLNDLDIFEPIYRVNLSQLIIYIRLGVDVDTKSDVGDTPLLLASKLYDEVLYDKNEFGVREPISFLIIKELIKSGANWHIKDTDGNNFLHYLNKNVVDKIKKELPDEYEKYLLKSNTQKYNL